MLEVNFKPQSINIDAAVQLKYATLYNDFSIEQIEVEQDKLNDIICCKLIKKLIAAFKKLKQCQPKIKFAHFGMGVWSFEGEVVWRCFDGDENKWLEVSSSETYDFESDAERKFDFEEGDYDSNSDWRGYIDGLFEFRELAESIQSRNMTTYFDKISEAGVHFEREVSPKTPMGYPPMSVLKDSFLYKQLKISGILVVLDEIK